MNQTLDAFPAKSYKAMYINRSGAICIRYVDYSEAMDMLKKGRFGAKGVRIEGMGGGGIYGIRSKDCGGISDDARVKWFWCWDDGGGLPHTDLDE